MSCVGDSKLDVDKIMVIPGDTDIPSPVVLTLSDRPNAGCHTSVNFALTAFSEVRLTKLS
jgi:hypothetical protein